jgi:hypothetical protein
MPPGGRHSHLGGLGLLILLDGLGPLILLDGLDMFVAL